MIILQSEYRRSGRLRRPSLVRSMLEFFKPAPKRALPHFFMRDAAPLNTLRVQSEQCVISPPVLEALQEMFQERAEVAPSDGRSSTVTREIELQRVTRPHPPGFVPSVSAGA